jgi:hypothetical protein
VAPFKRYRAGGGVGRARNVITPRLPCTPVQVLRITSTSTLSSAATPLFIDECATDGTGCTQLLALPTSANGAQLACTQSGSAGSGAS